MFGKNKPQSRIDSLIGAATRIEGNIVFNGGLRVDGCVRGNVQALPDQPATLVVSDQAPLDHRTLVHLDGLVVDISADLRA